MSGSFKKGPLKEAVDSAIRGVLYRALSGANGRVALAAKSVQCHRTEFYILMKRYGVTVERTARVVQKKPD